MAYKERQFEEMIVATVEVLRIVDGDTFYAKGLIFPKKLVRVEGGNFDTRILAKINKYRLADVWAPELSKPGGVLAKTMLGSLMDDEVDVGVRGIGFYNRLIAFVITPDGIDVNDEMRKRGYRLKAK